MKSKVSICIFRHVDLSDIFRDFPTGDRMATDGFMYIKFINRFVETRLGQCGMWIIK